MRRKMLAAGTVAAIVIGAVVTVAWISSGTSSEPASVTDVATAAETAGGSSTDQTGTDISEYRPESSGIRPAQGSGKVARVTDRFGAVADVSDAQIVINGKKLQGQKLLTMLGTCIFVNEHLIYPGTGSSHDAPYIGEMFDELHLIYRHVVRNNPTDNKKALQKVADFVAALPYVQKTKVVLTEDDGSIAVSFSGLPATSFFADYPKPIVSTFAADRGENRYQELVATREKRNLNAKFQSILQRFRDGKTLRVEKGKAYEVVDQ